MAYYIKVSAAEAEKRNLKELRNTTSDGSYLLWQEDFRVDCPSMEETELKKAVAAVGGLLLSPQEAKEERMGATSRPLPNPIVDEATEEDVVQSQPEVTESSVSEEEHKEVR